MAGNLRLTDADDNVLVLAVKNNPVLQGIVEFNTAIRQGSPRRDDRNLASFIVFEDGRGGVGQRVADIREDLDKIYASGGADLRRFAEAVKPPAWTFRPVAGTIHYLGGTSVRHATAAVLVKSELGDDGSVEDDDLIWAWVHAEATGATGPVGWTEYLSDHPTGDGFLSVFYKVAATEGASWTFNGTNVQVTAIALRGVDTADPWNAGTTSSAFPEATSHEVAGITTDEAQTMMFAYIEGYGDQGIGATDTLRFYDGPTNLIGAYESPGVQVRSRPLAEAGASGSFSAFHFQFEESMIPEAPGLVNVGSPNRTIDLVAFNAAAAADSEDEAVMLESGIDGTMRLYVAHFGRIYQTDGTDTELTEVKEIEVGAHITAMMEYELPAAPNAEDSLAIGDRLLLVCVAPNKLYVSKVDASPGGLYDTFTGTGGQGLFLFDGKAWAMGANTLHWSIDPAYSLGWTVLAGNWPSEWRFIGVFPYGETFMPYVLLYPNDTARAVVAVLNVDNATLVPLQLGLTGIVAARASSGEIAIVHNDGRDIGLYNPAFGGGLRDLDLQARSRNGYAPNSVVAKDVCPHPAGVIAIINQDAGEALIVSQLWLFKETGWMPISAIAHTDFIGYEAIRGMRWVHHLQHLVAFGRWAGGAELSLLDFPWRDEPFSPGVDFADPVYPYDVLFVTPWLDGGFADLQGALLAVRCGGYFTENLTVEVEYQLDGDESSSWVTLGTFPNTPAAEPEITGRADPVETANTLLFNGMFGLSFNSFRLRIALQNTLGLDLEPEEPNQSPNAYPLIVQFIKRPELRDQLRFEIDTGKQLTRNDQALSLQNLMTEIRTYYNHDSMLKIEWAGQTTYGFITSFPRVFTVDGGREHAGQVSPVADAVTGGAFVLTFAEPL